MRLGSGRRGPSARGGSAGLGGARQGTAKRICATTEHGWVYTDLGGLRGLNCSSWLIGWGCILGGLDGSRACLIYGWAGLDWVGAWVTSNKIDMIAIDVCAHQIINKHAI